MTEVCFEHCGEKRILRIPDKEYRQTYMKESQLFYNLLKKVAEEIHDISRYEAAPDETGEGLMSAVLDRRRGFSE